MRGHFQLILPQSQSKHSHSYKSVIASVVGATLGGLFLLILGISLYRRQSRILTIYREVVLPINFCGPKQVSGTEDPVAVANGGDSRA